MVHMIYMNGLAHGCGNCIALAMELLQFRFKPLLSSCIITILHLSGLFFALQKYGNNFFFFNF